MEHDRLTQYHRIAVRLKYLSGKEAPTPLELAEEMVAEIPEEIIADPKSTFLDPCAGIGTFGIALLKRLCKYHSEEHALSMIHLADVRRLKGKALERLGFKNIYVTDSLEKNWNMKFDVVIGNPPYNTGEVGKNKTCYHRFIELGCRLSRGISLMVTPGGYISSTGSKFKSTVEAMNVFGVSKIVYMDSKEFWPNLTIMNLNYSVLDVNASGKVEDFKIVDERLEAIKAEATTHHDFLRLVRGGQAYEHSDCTSEEHTSEFNTRHITRVNKNGPYKMYSNKEGYGAKYMVVMSERFSGLNPANVTIVEGDYSLSCNVIGLVFDNKNAAVRMAEYLTSKEIQRYIEAFKGREGGPLKLGVGRLIPDLTKEDVVFTPHTEYKA